MTTTRTRNRLPRAGVRASALATELWVLDEIGEYGVTARQFVANLKAANGGPVDLHLNSPGGDAFDGLAIYEALRQHAGRVTVYVDGLAASIASVIAMAADELVMGPSAMLMLHDAHTVTWGNEAEHLASAALLGQVSDTIAATYASRAGGTSAQWRTIMRGERWYTAAAAVAAGLADRIADAPALGSPVARLHRDHAGAAYRGQLASGLIVAALTARPAPRRAGPRRAAPSAMSTVRALKAAQRARQRDLDAALCAAFTDPR